MLHFLRTRSRWQVVAIGVLVAIVVVTVAFAGSHRAATRRAAAPAGGPPTAVPGSSASATASSIPPSPSLAAPIPDLPHTSSADVYAAAVARALLGIDYAATDRTALLAFWRAQFATALPAGVPQGTTLAQTQDAGMSTVTPLLPSPAMWTTLAQDLTVSRFQVTGVSEPATWVGAQTAGKIADPGLTARTVIGLQTLTYGQGATRRTTTQSQELTIAMLCPPTTAWCSLEIIPPHSGTGTAG